MAYKDPPKDKSMNAPGCAVIVLLVIGLGVFSVLGFSIGVMQA